MGDRSGVAHVPELKLGGNLGVAGAVLANLGHIIRGDVDVGARDGGHRTRGTEDTLDDGDVGNLDGLNVLVVLPHHRLVLVLLVLVNLAHPGRGRGGTLALLKPGGLARGVPATSSVTSAWPMAKETAWRLDPAGGDWGVDGDALSGGPGTWLGRNRSGGELGYGTGVADVADPVSLDFRVGAVILAHRGGLGDVGVPPVSFSGADAGEVLVFVGRDAAANFGLAVVRRDDAHLLHDLVAWQIGETCAR